MNKCCTKVIISLVMVLALMLNMAIPAMAVTAENFIVITTGTYINVRSGAGSNYSKLGTVQYAGTEYKYLDEAADSSGTTWYKVQYTSSKPGWISSEYSAKLAYTQADAQAYINAAAKRSGAVGIQVAVIENGVVAETYNYGYATKTSAVMTEDTKIRIASVSKVVLAMEAMRLQEADTLSINENIGTYWGAGMPKAVTLKTLFTHTSTLKSLSYSASKETTLSQITKSSNYTNSAIGSAKAWYYNNYAVGIAGSTIELASGKTVDSMVSEHFFEPLGIDASFFGGDLDDTSKLATLYNASDSVSRTVATQKNIHAGEPGTNTAYFAGGLTISAKDMAKLTAVLANDGTYYGVRYLDESSVAAIEEKQFNVSADGGTFDQCVPLRYKAGLYGQSELYYHTGNAYGVLSLMSYNPNTRNGVVVITTGASNTRDSQGIYDVCGKITSFLYTAADNDSQSGTADSNTSSSSATSTASSTSAVSSTDSSSVVSPTSASSVSSAASTAASSTTSSSTTTTTKFTTTTSDVTTMLTVMGSVVNVRSGAGAEYSKIGTVAYGDSYQVVGRAADSEGGTWYAIMLGDDIGFIDSTYCKLSTVTEPSDSTSSSSATSSTTSSSTTSVPTSSSSSSASASSTTSSSVPTTTTIQPASGKVVRLGGTSRLDTAILVSGEGWESADTVIIANGYTFADSLAGVPLAKALDAPILLTGGKTLEASVAGELTRLGAKKVYILGGEIAVSAEVQKGIESKGIKVERIAGATRYATAVEIAKTLGSVTGSQPSVFYFASAVNYPDALAISTVAALEGNPILYLPDKGEIDSGTAQFVSQSTCNKAVILGGELAVSAQGESSVKKYISSVERIYGQSRYDTALKICRTYASIFTSDDVALATGVNFPDALSGGALAAKYGMPIVLVGAKADSSTADYINSLSPKNVYVFGGTGAVADSVVNELLK